VGRSPNMMHAASMVSRTPGGGRCIVRIISRSERLSLRRHATASSSAGSAAISSRCDSSANTRAVGHSGQC
jgi:hypothetical protein